uniref:Peptidase C1A papain C-terminal domain-containing protein n=1 Tax=Plectus sambesii TaxID=2011161 RepID=A0A914UUC7_9BILA
MSWPRVGIVICLVVIAVVILLGVAVHLLNLRPPSSPLFPVVDDYHATLILRVNSPNNATWTARFNRFAVRAADQLAFYPSTEHVHNIFPRMLEIDSYAKNVLLSVDIAGHLVRLAVIQSVPEHFDAREQWPQCWSIGHVADQGECGSCWAMAIVGSMSDRICIQSNGALRPLLSVQQLVSCCDYCGT